MAAYDLEEQEQIENLKAWWQQHGGKIAAAVMALALGVASWQGWNWYQQSQAAGASVLFGQLQQAIVQNKPQVVRSLAGELMEKYDGTDFAVLSALAAAKVSFDSGDLKSARAQLDWAFRHAQREVQDVIRLRQASVMLDEKAYDEALSTLAHTPNPAFAPAYAELKGDILLAQGKPTESRAAYKEAMMLRERQLEQQKAELGLSAMSAKPVANATVGAKEKSAEDVAEDALAGDPASQLLKQKLDALGGA